MLILTDTDRFRINFYQLCQRILHPAGNGCRASLSHIKIREFLRCKLACGINGCACLVCDHVRHLFRNLFEQLHDDLLRFPRCRSIAKRDQCDSVFANQRFQCLFCCFDLRLVRRRGRINDRCIKDLSSGIDYRQLAAGTERRIPPKHDLTCDWRLHQKLFQIFTEYGDCSILRFFGQCTADFTLNRRCDQSAVAVCHCCL